MVEIKLANKVNDEPKYDYSLKVSKKNYLTEFEKITYNIEYKEKIGDWFASWWKTSTTFHVYIIDHSGQIIFTYNAKEANHEVKKVEAYYNKTHPHVPLVIGFYRDDPGEFTYFTYSFLKIHKSHRGLPKNSFQSGQLQQELKREDNRVNRIKFFNSGGSYKNCDLARENITSGQNQFVKICYTVSTDSKRYDDHELTKHQIFTHDSGIEVHNSYFESVHGKYFDSVCVYCTNESITRVLLVEFVNSNTSNKYFSRQDKYGYYWVEKPITENVETELQKIQTESENKIAFLLNKLSGSYGQLSINVGTRNFSELVQYTHKPQSGYQNKKSYILYNGSLISLETINEIFTNKLNDPQNQIYSSVITIFKRSKTEEVNEPPFFLELVGSGTTKYYLHRVDNRGLKWTQTDVTTETLRDERDKRASIFTQLEYFSYKSIVILANENENGGQYPLYLVDNSVSAIVKSESQPKLTDKISVKQNQGSLSDYKYSCYEHSVTQPTEAQTVETTDNNFLLKVSGLRVFIGSNTKDAVELEKSIEIKLFDQQGVERKYLYYDSNSESQSSVERKNKIYAYFYGNDNVPLMIYAGDCFYTPKSKNEYFDKWVQIPELKITDKANVATKLKDINKELNLIDLSLTSSYGLRDPDGGQLPENFDTNRITVSKDSPNSLFNRVTHTTNNNGPIGKITYSNSELKVVSGETNSGNGTPISTQITNDKYNTVKAYYHLADSSHKKPLIIGISKSVTQTPDLFYERIDNTGELKWKKIESHQTRNLSNDNTLAEKINKLHYDFNYSIKIQIEKQGSSGIDNYNLELVKNIGTDTVKLPSPDNKITSVQYTCLSGTNYTCYKHTITLGNTRTSDVGGLRFYLGDKEITFSNNLGKLVIYYNYINFQVQVYFYSNNRGTDNVPLLFEYNGKYYGPKSKDDYFNQWVLVDGLSSSSLSQQIITKLDQINKSLNEVNISITKGGSSYGLKKPETGIKGIDESFYNRVNVQQGDRPGYYKKLVHSSINKGPIGKVMYNGKNIQEINASELQITCNQVCVYYHISDPGYNRPLLICIGSQNHVNSCVKWYYRQNVEGTQWKDDATEKYKGDDNIRGQLQLIQSRDSNFIFLQIDKQGSSYQITTKTGAETEEESKIHISTISVDGLKACSSYEVNGNYKCFKHEMSNYYIQNKVAIKTALQTHDQEPTLEMKIEVAGKVLELAGTDGSPLPTPLTYGSKEERTHSDPYVYFFEPTDTRLNMDTTDKLPLLFVFNNRFFGPVIKDQFFEKWKEYDINTYGGSGRQERDKIKSLLNYITRLLNDIQLQTSSGNYGDIKPTQGPDNPLGANKRVLVTRNTGSNDYHMVTHSTANTGCVGSVKHNGNELTVVGEEDRGAGVSKTMLQALEEELSSRQTYIYNNLTAYYHYSDARLHKPLLIGISGAGSSNELFYQRMDYNNDLNWKKIKNTESLRTSGSGIEEKVNQIFYDFTSSVKIDLTKNDKSGYLVKLVKNGEPDSVESRGDGRIKVSKGNCFVKSIYTCITQSVTMNEVISSQVGGLRFYFDKKEVKTFKDNGARTTMSVFYNDRIKDVHVYLQESTNVPLLFRYNGQCFKPYSKADYFTKWVYDSNIKTGHLNSTQLNTISEMLNEINLKNTGNGRGGDTQQYGLEKPHDVGDTGMKDFNRKRITATRTPDTKPYKSVMHTTNNNLGIGKVMFDGTEVKDNQGGGKNLFDAVKDEPGLLATKVNEVIVYYHTIDTEYSTPLMLGFGRTGAVGPDTSAQTPKVFYERLDSNKPPTKWKRVRHLDTGEQDITEKLEEIRYNIGKSVVIYVENQEIAGQGYEVKLVDNKTSGGRTTQAGQDLKIQVKKDDSCFSGQQSDQKYTCYTQTIPGLTSSPDHPLIGGVRFYVCSKYLPTYGKGGYPPEHIYYDDGGKREVKVYFYSSGHGPPTGGEDTSVHTNQQPDNVPLLVQYGQKYYRPSSRVLYFSTWEHVTVSDSGDGENSLSTVLHTVNRYLNTVDISKTNGGYGIYTNGITTCPCSTPNNFCDRISVKREPVSQNTQAQGDLQPASGPTLFHRVTHTTFNKARIGDVYYGTQPIKAIETTKVEGCNLFNVYYDANDTQCKNPLLICLGEQKGEGSSNDIQPTNNCKKWYKRKGIDISDWVSVDEGEYASKYGSKESIKQQLQEILTKFSDYLYLEIDNRDGYQPKVQHQTGEKKKVGDSGSETKIQVEDTGGVGDSGSEVQVPEDYKAYKHKLSEFYNGAKDEINNSLKKSLPDNQVPDSSDDQSQNPTLYLRLQIAGQVVTLATEGGTPLTEGLKYGKEQAVEPGDSGTSTANDPVVYFYKGTGTEDTVPLLFQYQKRYFGPKDRHSYFREWQQVSIIGSGENGGNDGLKNKLDEINLKLNEIDLTQTGGSRLSGEYGLPDAGVSRGFKTGRIKTEKQTNQGNGPIKYTTISHTTSNGYNIGDIKTLGSCKFDNNHTEQLGKDQTHNEAVAIYETSDGQYQRPKLVLVAESKGTGLGSGSNVLGYYDLTNGDQGKCDGEIKFTKLEKTFTLTDLTKRDSVKDEKDLLTILIRIGIVTPEAAQIQTQVDSSHLHSSSTEALGSGLHVSPEAEEGSADDGGYEDQDSRSGDGDSHSAEDQDDRPKVGSGDGGNERGGSGGMDTGTKAQEGSVGPAGKDGQPGQTGARGQSQPATQLDQTDHSSGGPSPTLGTTSGTTQGSQQQSLSGNIDGGGNGGGDTSKGTMEEVLEIIKKPEVYASASGTVGAGVMATVGAVVYKKCTSVGITELLSHIYNYNIQKINQK